MSVRPLTRQRCVILEEVERKVTFLELPDTARRGTYGLSMRPDRLDLARLDADAPRANVGRLLAVPGPDQNPSNLKVGDIVLYDQHSTPADFTPLHAQTLGRALGRSGWAFVVPIDRVLCRLPGGVPADGLVK